MAEPANQQVQLKGCAHCGSTPVYEGDPADWHDDSRYVQLSLVCCVTMVETIGWRQARDMSVNERRALMESRLAARWNTRWSPDGDRAQG